MSCPASPPHFVAPSKTIGSENLLSTKRGTDCGDADQKLEQAQSDTLDYNRNYRLSDRRQRRVTKVLPPIHAPLGPFWHRLRIIWRKNLRGAGGFAEACWHHGKKVLLRALAAVGPAFYNLLKAAWSPAGAGLLSTKPLPECGDAGDEAGQTQSDTLDYNRIRGWRGGPPPRQNKNWIPRIALLETIALALFIVNGFAGGGFLRIPGMPLPSKSATAGTPKAFETAGLAIAWAINDVIAGAFHGSGGFQSAVAAGGEINNRRGAASGARSSASGSRPWTSSWLTLNQGTPSNHSGTSQTFRALADILSTHKSSKKPLVAGSSVGGRGVGSGASGIGHTTGSGAVLATPGVGTDVAGGAGTNSEKIIPNGGGNAGGLVTNSLASSAANADITFGNNTASTQTSIGTATGSAEGSAPVVAAAGSGSAGANEDAERDWGNTGSDFNTNANWTAGTGGVAPGVGDVAWFKSSGSFLSPNLSASKTISGIYFNGTGSSGYNLTRSTTQTFTLTANGTSIGLETGNASSVAIGAENTSGTNTIAVPIVLAPATGSTSTIFQAAGGTLVLSGVISGTGINLTKTGGGTLTLSATNTFSGGLTLSAGTLNINNSSTLGTGTFTIDGGTTIDNTSAGALSPTNAQTWNGDFTFTGTNNLTFSGNVALGATTRQVTVNAGTLTESGVISGTGGITKAGTGALLLKGVNTYTGTTNIGTAGGIDGGTITLGINSALPSTAVNIYGGTLSLGTFSDTIGALNLGGGASGTTASITGTGTLTLGGNVTYDATNNPNGATISSKLALGATRTFNIGDSTAAAADLTVSGVISGTGFGLTKTGDGTLSLSGANTYTGDTTVSQGTLEVDANAGNNANGALGHTANAVIINDASTGSSNTALLIGTTGISIGRNITVANSGTGTTTLGGDITSGTGTFSGGIALNKSANFNADGTSNITFSGAITGVGNLAKTGTGTVTLSSTSNAYTGTTNIGIAGGVGAGTLALGASNVLPGTTVDIYGGTLSLGAFSDTIGALNLGGGASGTTASITGTGTLTLGGNVTYNATNNPNGATISSALALGATRTFNIGDSTAAAADLIVSGVISGTGFGITKSGAGTLSLSGANTYTGDTAVTGGTLTLANTLALQDSTLNYNNLGGTLSFGSLTSATLGGLSGAQNLALTNASSAAVALTVGNNNTNTTYSGMLSGLGSLTKSGTGTWTLSGANSYSGATTVAAGTLSVASIGNSGANSNLGANGTVDIGSTTTTGTLLYTGTGETSNKVINLAGTTGGAVLDQSGTGLLKFTSDLTATGVGAKTLTLQGSTTGTGEISGAIVNGSGTTSVTKTGTDTWTLSGANTYTGATTISAGILNIQNATALGTTAAGTTVSSGATLQLQGGITVGAEALNITGTGASGQTGALVNVSGTNNYGGPITLAASTTISSDSDTLNINGAVNLNSHGLTVGGSGRTLISGVISGAGATSTLTKSGSGALRLTAANTYGSSSTTVNGGTLLVNNTTGSGTGGGAVTVNNSGSTLGGTGTISARVTVNAGANLSPGNGGHTTAIFTIGSLTLQSTSNFLIDINGTTAGTGYDQLQVTGAGGTGGAVITGSNLQVHVGTTLTVGEQFTIAHHAGGYLGQFAEGNSVTDQHGDVFSINYSGGPSHYDIVLTTQSVVTVVPEPSTWIGGAFAVAALAYTQRRRLKQLFLLRRAYGGQVVSS